MSAITPRNLQYTIVGRALEVHDAEGERVYTMHTINDLPDEIKPRERMIRHGPSWLSLSELLAVMIGVGTKKESVLHMSQRVLREYGERGIVLENNPTRLKEKFDIPIVAACKIVACFELGKRLFQENPYGEILIRKPEQVFEYTHAMRNLAKEHLRALYLNSRNQLIHDELISIGTLTSNLIHPREVFQPAVKHAAAAIILVHNHPSGSSEASVADIVVTKQLIEVGKIMGIDILDHVIVTKEGFSSVPAPYISTIT